MDLRDNIPTWENLTDEERDQWCDRVESDLDLRDLWINAEEAEAGVLRELIDRIARNRYREEVRSW